MEHYLTISTEHTGWDLELERDLLADGCRRELWWFVKIAFGVSHPENSKGTWLCERIHKPICDWFTKHVRDWLGRRKHNEQKNLFIVIPRDFGKSVLITKAGILWLHLQDPELSSYIGSITKDMAIEFLDPIKKIIDGEDAFQLFTWLYGNWYNKDHWTSESVVHAVRRGKALSEPSFGVWGAATGLVGKHPDVICFDDPISYNRMETHSGWIEYVNRHITSLIPVLKGNGLRIFIGTRYHDGDWIGRAIKLIGVRSVSGMDLPDAIPMPGGMWDMYYLAARDNRGVPIYPERWPESKLREYELENRIEYYAQMMNDPTSETVMALTRKQVDQMWVERKDVPKNLRVSVHLDTAFKVESRKRSGDESVIEVWGHTRDGSGTVYFLEGYSSREWRAEDFNNKLTYILKSLRARSMWPYKITDETEMGGKQGTWELTIVNWCASAGLPPPNVQLLSRGGKSKLSRQLAAATFWVDGRVKLVRDAPGADQLVDQMLKIGVSDHDDWSDAGADVFHPEVYNPMRLQFDESDLGGVRPYDQELQDGTLSVWTQVRNYREARRRERDEQAAWGVIGNF